MGRRKHEEVFEATVNLDEQVSEETEVQEESLAEETSEEAVTEEKPKRARRNRKAKIEPTLEVEAFEEESLEEVSSQEVEEKVEEIKPKRQRGSRRKNATPETQLEVANEAMQKTMEEMVKQWNTVKEITGTVTTQLEKVAHIVKPSIQDFVNTSDSITQPKVEKSQFAMKFASAASIVAVLLSLVSMSLSQSARTVALNAEATRVANSQLFPSTSTKESELAFQKTHSKQVEVFGPKTKPTPKGKRF